jgi:hypothetical protein
MIRKLIVIVAAGSISACAMIPPTTTYSYNNSKTVEKSYDLVWEELVGFFAANNIQIKNIAKESGVIYAESARFDDAFADCGDRGSFIITGRQVNFNVFVNRSGKHPVVSVNTDFTQTGRFESRFQTVQCNSKGVIETRILGAV